MLRAFDKLNGSQPGYRPAHAKGILLAGIFTPASAAKSLTRAPHVQRASTPVTVRFSDFAGIPTVPDNDPNASPRGMATRFNLAEHVHTDIIAHSVDAFPVHTAEEFLEFLDAINESAGAARPTPVERFLADASGSPRVRSGSETDTHELLEGGILCDKRVQIYQQRWR